MSSNGKPRIVITDGYTLNPGDLDWAPFQELGEVIYYDRSAAGEIKERCLAANIIITNKTPISAEVINAAENLRLIAVTATGYNIIDVAAATKKKIAVCNVPDYGTYSVAQHAFSLLLELTNHVGIMAASVQAGDWYTSTDWCYVKAPLMELKDKTLGIVGMGKIGGQMAKMAMAFGMQVIYHRGKAEVPGAQKVALPELFQRADVVSLHCPLTPDNNAFINKELLGSMKPNAFLLNTSRGQLINEADLAEALRGKRLAGAALDVLSSEPPKSPNPLIGLPNCIITPHNAWISFEARTRLLQVTFENVQAALKGELQHVVNPF